MPATNINDLIEILDLKDYLKIKNDDEEALLESMCTRASAIFEGFCNRDFINADSTGLVEITEYQNGEGNKIFLDLYPVATVTSVYDDMDREFGEDTLVDPDDYIVRAKEGIIEGANGYEFVGGTLGVKIKYTAGYVRATLPKDITQAVIEIAALLYKERDSIGLSSKSYADGSASFFSDKLSIWTKSTIDNYKKSITFGV